MRAAGTMSRSMSGIFRSSTEVLTNVMRKLRTLPLPLLLLVPALFPAPAILRADVVNRIVLRVNDQIATLRDYEQRRQDLTRDVSRRPNMDPEERSRMLEQVPQLVFRDLYQELLLESRAQQLAIEVSHAQIDAAVENMKQNFGIKTDEDFRQAEQVHLREVVVLEQGGIPTADERSRTAAEIRQAVTGGKSLADAIADLQPKGITSNVIDLGWVGHGDLDATLEAAAWKLAPGAITEPVAGRGGLHLLQVAERHESRIPAFSEVSQQIQEQEQERVYSEEFNKYMAELEKKSLIVASPPQEAEGFRSLLTRPVADRLELQPAQVQSQPRIGTEGRTPPADSVQGAPGALPQPKPVDTTPPPVAPPPAH